MNKIRNTGIIIYSFNEIGASLVGQLVKNLPTMQETWVQFLGWEDPLERKWQPTPVFLPGESRGQRSLAGYSPWGCKSRTQLLNENTLYIKVDKY